MLNGSTQTYEITSNIPAPIRVQQGIPVPPHGNVRYPFRRMKVGDSFLANAKGHASPTALRCTLLTAARNQCPKAKFTTRLVANGARIWRVE